MERNFTNENFERFLRQNADGLRMRPADKVWKGISRHLNRRRRRIGFILSVSILALSSLGYYYSEHRIQAELKTNPLPTTSAIGKGTAGKLTIAGNVPVAATSLTKTQKAVDQIPRNFVTNDLASISNDLMLLPFSSPGLNSLDPQNTFTPTIIDSYEDYVQHEPAARAEESKQTENLLTIESVVNSYQRKVKKSKLNWEVFFTPTVSYRKLSENKTYQQAVPQANAPLSYLYNVNSMVTHKPDFGFEIGFAAKYPISNSVKLRAGMQFNVNRYDIKAFSSPTQLATIRLNDRSGTGQVNTATNYNNFSGYKTNWLENFYFQVSSPVGIEVKLRGDDKMQFGVASTIQPTYVLGDRAYLISSDYKNYAEVPWLIRRWNVNTSFETFVAYSTGHLKWQVGPQVRYQLLSSFVNKYPVKENLFDFGLKVGVSVNH